MDKSRSYRRMFDILTISHRKNKNPAKVLMKPRKERAFTENENELYRNKGCVNRES